LNYRPRGVGGEEIPLIQFTIYVEDCGFNLFIPIMSLQMQNSSTYLCLPVC